MDETGNFFTHFSVVPDPRVDRTKRHLLVDILFIAICTFICGGEGFTDMEAFGTAKKEWLEKFLELPFGIPSHDSFRSVISRIRKDNAPENLSILRKIDINTIKRETSSPKASIRVRIKKAAWDNSYLGEILVS